MTDEKYIAIVFLQFFFLSVLCVPYSGSAQYIDLRLDVETESTVKTEKTIDFGSFNTNAGTMKIMLGDINMGVFSINAIESQELLMGYREPRAMRHQNAAITDRIPFTAEVAYGFDRNDFRNTGVLSKSLQGVLIKENPDVGPWNNLYIFIYGTVEIGNIVPGVYSTDIILDIQYI